MLSVLPKVEGLKTLTPFDISLQHDLELEQNRFANEWLFRWHNLNIEGKIVDVDRFDGGRIALGGIKFGDQQQSIYWQAIARYLTAKAHYVFKRWDDETNAYPAKLRRSSLEAAFISLNAFVSGIVTRAIKTDQAVRGRGHPKTDEPYQVPKVRTQVAAEIRRLKEAHSSIISLRLAEANRPLGGLWDAVSIRPGLWGVNIDLKKLFQRNHRRSP